MVLHELRAYLNASSTRGELTYWRSGSGNEVDFIWSWGDRHMGIEVKSANHWKRSYGRGLRTLIERRKIERGYGIYLGPHAQKDGAIHVLPFTAFVRALNAGEILSMS